MHCHRNRRRGPDAGSFEVGFVVSPDGSPPVVPGENPQSSLRVGYRNALTGEPYFETYNAAGQVISPITGQTVARDTAHYPISTPELTATPP